MAIDVRWDRSTRSTPRFRLCPGRPAIVFVIHGPGQSLCFMMAEGADTGPLKCLRLFCPSSASEDTGLYR